MSRAPLHLIDTAGSPVRASIRAAVEEAYHWVVRKFPLVDPAHIADWAEEVASSMQAISPEVTYPARYANAALKGKVRDWLRTRPAQQQLMGIGPDLERIGGVDKDVQNNLDRKLFFEQVKPTLSDRDQVILALLLDGMEDMELADALGIKHPAGRKAIQRVKQRMAAYSNPRKKFDPKHGSPTLCETKG